MSFIILDLDNTISDDSWRISRIDWNCSDPFLRYHKYHSLSSFDNSGNQGLFLGTLHDIIIATARPVLYYAQTEEWLRRIGIDPAIIMMRNNDDHNHSRDLKRRQFIHLIDVNKIPASEIVCAYDDQEDIVGMYRAFGIKAEVRRIHNLSYGDPK